MSQPVNPNQASGPAQRRPAPGTSAASASFSRPGAVDLSQIAAQASAQQTPPGSPGGAGSYTVEVTQAELNSVLQQSMNYPVVIALLSGADPGCQQLRATLTRISDDDAGRWLLATVDVDTQPGIAQAFQVQAVPTVMAVIGGQIAPLFQGTADEQQVRAVLKQVLDMAVANGVAGRAAPVSHPDAGPDPRFVKADEAMAAGDYATAIAEYDKLLAANPKDREAAAARATAAMLLRSPQGGGRDAIAAADADPADIDKAFAAADAEIIAGNAQNAFSRLIGLIRTTAGEDRERLRVRVLELFETMDPADPVLLAARRDLGSALF
ncbi:tetratricopeptide repeat protein [Propionibacterium australiense]|uniref:YbbN n=1 Tax=Propionibacterium australiense TaxID=119981 RepID=A0A383S309_9ACTN|nr:tetratricopeptide repeat protein [Propionibacterium australiense]RLP11630.1 co-chaperone YbbN [Propionibacterium australiense]RLP12143.1 co-chaperone YbbN [Propionibacterium australiense]SYZ32360.1 ybbN [Propionibacterium australiense]VEH90369.1 thioredoxin [Propionibacterium australiense]